jgi:membrane-associated phospholipid phosphatase
MTKSVSTSIVERVRAELPLKLVLLVALNLTVWVPYRILQRVQFFPATSMPFSAIDHAIPFSSGAVWAYLSIYAFLPLGPFLLEDRQRILQYAQGVLAMSVIATIIFVFWPTVCPRPDASGTNAVYRALIAIDNPYHAFPSLHAAFAIYSALYAIEAARQLGWRRATEFGFWVWAGLILYATLATRQHVFIDILTGSLLGFVAYHGFSIRLQRFRIRRPHLTQL